VLNDLSFNKNAIYGEVEEGSYGPILYQGDPYAESMASQKMLTPEQLAHRKAEQVEWHQAPQLIRTGQVEFSTCHSVERWPVIVWDTNNYYRELGISFRASNRDIKEAYQKLNGQLSVRLTYIVKQLLNSVIRERYDATKPGGVFFDKYIAEYVKSQMLKDHIKEHGRSLSLEEQIAQGHTDLGLDEFINKEFSLDGVDNTEAGKLPFRWGYYLKATHDHQLKKLRVWQQVLCRVFDISTKLTLGLFDGDTSAYLERIGYRDVAFINVHAEPTERLAQRILNDYKMRYND
jgi:hypothetical protein